MKRILSVLLMILFLLTGCSGMDEVTSDDPIFLEFQAQSWTLTCAGGKDSIDTQAAEYFAQLIYRETNGAVQVTVNRESALPAVDSGEKAPELSLFSSLLWSEQDPRFSVLSLPFLFTSETNAANVLDGEGGQALANVLTEYNQYCLGIGSGGFRCPTNSLRPIASPSDLAGLRLRIDNYSFLQDTYALWGADCVSLNWPLVYTALRTGTHDGQEMSLETANQSSIHEVQKHVTDWTGLYSGLIFSMDAELYDRLSPSLKEIVGTCSKKTIEHQRRLQAESHQNILSRWRKAKVTVTSLTPEAAAEFRAAAQPCYDRFAENISAELLQSFTR